MQLWTIQPHEVWELLQQKRSLKANKGSSKAFTNFENPVDPYVWMAEQMRKRLPTSTASFPWWAWHRWQDATHPKPDLRAKGWDYPRGETHVRLELEMPDEEVLLSDYQGWHAVLNGWYNGLSEDEDDEFDRRLEQAGVPWQVEPFKSEVIASWERIFDLDGGDPDWGGNPAEREIQATFWTLSLEHVRDVTVFVGRRRPRRAHKP